MDDSLRKVIDAPYDEALARVPAALHTEGFGVLTEIDVRDTLHRKLGVDFRRYPRRLQPRAGPPGASG